MKMNQSVVEVKKCLLCSEQGGLLYSSLKDSLFGAEGTYDIFSCTRCSLLWLNPRPTGEAVAKLYTNYYTHETVVNNVLVGDEVNFNQFPKSKKIKYAVLSSYFGYDIPMPSSYRMLGYILGAFPSIYKKVQMSTGGFSSKKKGKLLDVGCGNGDYLLEMKYLGHDVQGVEIDPRSAHIARNGGLSVITGPFVEGLYQNESFDAIYLNNVIEHVENPKETISLCYKLLKKGGELCIKTCSSESMAHSFFKKDYRGLEIPRHFFIFSPRALRSLGTKEGFSIKKRYTTFNGYIWAASRAIKRGDSDAAYATESRVDLLLQKILVSLVTFMLPDKGDDIFVLFKK